MLCGATYEQLYVVALMLLFKLGIGYLNGQFGLDKNYREAEKWLQKAASQGHPDAERCLQEAFSKLAFS